MWPFRKKAKPFDSTDTYMTNGRLDWGKINTPNYASAGCLRPALSDLDARLRAAEEVLGFITPPAPVDHNPAQPTVLRHTNARLERIEEELRGRAN